MSRENRDHDYYRGVRACIAWLHERALEMNDPHAKAILNSAAYLLGVDKPAPARVDPIVSNLTPPEEDFQKIKEALSDLDTFRHEVDALSADDPTLPQGETT